MEKTRLLSLAIVLAAVTGCASFKQGDDRAAICHELKSKMMFSGSTSISRTADIQNSEDLLRQRQYEKYHCDEI